ncbi:MAG: hypothetical protein GY940_46220 [bacterium]|nr:hypothetical protein [bacterium]
MNKCFSIFLIVIITCFTGVANFAAEASWDYDLEVIQWGLTGVAGIGDFEGDYYYSQYSSSTRKVTLMKHDGVNPSSGVFTITGNSGSGFIRYLTAFNGKVYFYGPNGNGGYDIWEWDRTNAPVMVSSVNFSSVTPFQQYDGKLYFSANEGIHGLELWVFDGVNQPTLVEDLYPGTAGNVSSLMEFNGKLIFRGWSQPYGHELHQYDGAGISLLADLKPGSGGSSPQSFVQLNGKFYFIAYGNSGSEIWEYDGVNPPFAVTAPNTYPSELVSFDNRLLFLGYDATHGQELWEYDGANPPHLLYDLSTRTNESSQPRYFTVLNNRLFFTAIDGPRMNEGDVGREIWMYDGNQPPELFKDVCEGAQSGTIPMSSNAHSLAAAGGRLYFMGSYCISYKIMMFDGILIPSVETLPASAVTGTSASVGGNIIDNGGASLLDGGICWSTSPNPTIADNTISTGTGTGAFTLPITGLAISTTYYFRAYATNSTGTAYGSEESFTTLNIETFTLWVQSDTDSGVNIMVSPDDNSSNGDGTTNFTRTYNDGTIATLTAPLTSDELTFTHWTLDGVDNTAASIQVTMTASHSATAHYILIIPPTYSVLASNSIRIKDHAIVHSGLIGAFDASPGPYLNAGYEVTIGQSVTVADGSVIYGDSVKIKSGASVDEVHYNNLDNNGTIRGTEVSPLALPLEASFPSYPTPAPGTGTIDIAKNDTLTLAPGSYGEIIVRANATLILTGGTYHLENLALGDNNSSVKFEGAGEVIINSRFEPGSSAYIGPADGSGISADDIRININGTNGGGGGPSASPKVAVIGYNNQVTAHIYAPNGTIWVKSGSIVEGSLIGKDVLVGSNVEISLPTDN